jgi:Protein of unknown function (DUF1566)
MGTLLLRNCLSAFLALFVLSSVACKKFDKGVSNATPVLATLSTASVTGITDTSATCGGNITSDGGSAVTARGLCWDIHSTPTLGSSTTFSTTGSGTGVFTGSMMSLTKGTVYYVRAYATNSAGTAYGDEQVFTTTATPPVVAVPSVTTNAVTTITGISAVSGGNVTSDGNSVVFARGVCWSIHAAPTDTSYRTSDGRGTGSFTSNLSSLLPGTTYHVRAFATNSAGTGYGAELVFTTSFSIGMDYGGGKIAYVLQNGDVGYDPNVVHGLICAPADISLSYSWGCPTFVTGAEGYGIGMGPSNTTAIIAACSGTAAGQCRSITINGYSDWSLPSISELQKLYENRLVLGGFTNVQYWSSTQYSTGFANGFDFSTGTDFPDVKSNAHYLRPIRIF